MGFGTLFIGYFLLLNIFNYAYTDLIASLILALGAYKLSSVSPDFKRSLFVCIPLGALGIYELTMIFWDMFGSAPENELITGILGILRCALIGAFSFLILRAIKKLSQELDIPRLTDRAKSAMFSVTIAYSVSLILEIPSLDKIIPTKAIAVIALLSLAFTFFSLIYALTAIYSAYMRICMPEDLIKEEKQSKFTVVNKFRENEKKRGEEYANYKVNKFNETNSKKGKK